jgi:hypothetical protein
LPPMPGRLRSLSQAIPALWQSFLV